MRAIIFYFNLLPVTSHNWSKRFHCHQEFSHLYRLNIHVYYNILKKYYCADITKVITQY